MSGDYTPERLRRAQEEYARQACRALNRVANRVLGEAQREAPVEEGTLRASGAVALDCDPRRLAAGGDARARISFATPYAARQHEHDEYRHPKGGKAFYLRDPVQRCRLADELRREMRL
jgi:hypothetical protein